MIFGLEVVTAAAVTAAATVAAGSAATVAGLQAMNIDRNTVFSIVAVVLGVVTIFASIVIWQGRHEIGGTFAIVPGIVFLVLQPETAGIFAVLGGIMAIAANRIVDIVTETRSTHPIRARGAPSASPIFPTVFIARL